jgi:hypothetical protein
VGFCAPCFLAHYHEQGGARQYRKGAFHRTGIKWPEPPFFPLLEVRSYFPELVGAWPVVAVGFAASPISGVVAAVGSGFFFTGPIVSGGAGLSML